MIRISLDLMGGDFGPQVVIPGAAKALDRHPDTVSYTHLTLPTIYSV